MNDLKLDQTTHDLVITNGDLELLNKESMVARQSLTINLLFFQGEWFLDLEYGVPYLQSILTKISSKKLVDNIIKQKVLESYRIERIDSFRSEIKDGVYSISILNAVTTDGNIVSITNQKLFEE